MVSRRPPSAVAEQAAVYQVDQPGNAWLAQLDAEPDNPDLLRDFAFIAHSLAQMTDDAQITIIRHGLSAHYARSMAQTFDISVSDLAKALQVSESTLTRKSRDNALLDPSATERLMRIAAITALATEVFEDEEKAIAWMKRDNLALGGQAPLVLCDNDISAMQVRRVLHAIEFGGAV